MELRKSGFSPYVDLEKDLLCAAFCELALEENSANIGEDEKGICDAANDRLLKRLRREYRRIRLGAAVKKTARQVSRAAVFLIFIAAVAGGIAVASNSILRARLYEVVVDYTNVENKIRIYAKQMGEIDLPDGWWVPFYHTYIPEGYELVAEEVNPNCCYQYYQRDDKGEEICGVTYWSAKDSFTNISTEDAEISYVNVRDNIATVIKREEKSYMMFWTEGDVRIVVDAHLPYDEAMKILEGILPIDIEAVTGDE